MSCLGEKIAILVLAVILPTAQARAGAVEMWQQPVAASPGATSPMRLVQDVPDRLVVTRTKNNRNNPNAPPYSGTINDRASVGKLYAEVLALPPLGGGPRNCPNDLGISYHLDFYSGTTSLLAADYDPTGCASVTLSDGTVKSAATGSFRADLSQALGFSPDRQFLGLP